MVRSDESGILEGEEISRAAKLRRSMAMREGVLRARGVLAMGLLLPSVGLGGRA